MTDDVIAQTPQGRLRGVRDGHALRFLGIPYAQSPVTAGRFAAPVPHGRWDGTRDALAYGATSPQPDRGVTLIPEPIITGDNELNLNVFTADLGAAGLPVLVWIHGGGFFGGGNASPWYRGGPFARDGVVLVSINYRLGAEGFLEVPDAPANRAVRDWVRALEWVQENIAAFGGDPGRVTIAGQSAGGAACATLLGVPAARGLFRAAVCMSGGAALRQTAGDVRDVAAQMAGHLGVSMLSRAVLEELPAETILAAQEVVMATGTGAVGGQKDGGAVMDLLSGGIRLPWAPWTDGEVVTEDPVQAAASPRHSLAFHCLDVPFVFDTLSEQGVREAAGQAPPASLAADMHGAWVRFVTDGDPGWERYETSSRPLMVFAEPSEIRGDPLRRERTAWASRSRSSLS